MSWWWCCCGGSCSIHLDGFSTLDTSPSGRWEVLGGSWESSADELASCSDGRKLKYTDSKAAKYQVITNWVNSNNYYYAELEFEPAAETDSTISLYKVVDGTPTLLHSGASPVAADESATFTVCHSEFCFYATTAIDDVVWHDNPGAHAEGYKAGLGIDGDILLSRSVHPRPDPSFRITVDLCLESNKTAPHYFDNFDWQQHWLTRKDCFKCVCYYWAGGNYNAIAPKLRVTLAATGELEDYLDGATIDLPVTGPGTFTWFGEETVTGTGCCSEMAPSDEIEIDAQFECDPGDGDPDDEVFTFTIDFDTPGIGQYTLTVPVSHQHDPLEIVYGFTIPSICEPPGCPKTGTPTTCTATITEIAGSWPFP